MAISGSLRTMQFSELLQWLSTGLKSGTLIIRGAPGEKRIYFQDGKIVSSSSTVEREFLGRFLVGFGFITEEELVRALEVQQESKILLGKILVMIGAIREEELADLIRLKAAETIYDIFLWEEGSFAFIDGQIPALSMVPISSDVTGIVMEGLRRYDEWQRIRTRITSLRQIPSVLIPVEEGLNDREKMILSAIDGTHAIDQIAMATHNPDFHVAKFVFDLLESGHMQIVGERPEEAPSASRREAELAAESVFVEPEPRGTVLTGLVVPPPADLDVTVLAPGAGPHGEATGKGRGRPAPRRGAAKSPPAKPEPAAPPAAAPGPQPAQYILAPPGPATPPPQDFARFLTRPDSGAARRSADSAGTLPNIKAPPLEPALPEALEAPEDAGPMPDISPVAVPRLTKPMEELMSCSFTPNEAFIVSRINGIWDVRSIARISPFPEIEVLRVFQKLETGGFVTLT
jgi:hypothetical protein